MDKNRILLTFVLGITILEQSWEYKALKNEYEALNGLKIEKTDQKTTKNRQKTDEIWFRNINLADKYQKYIYNECQKYGFDYDLALAVAKYESNFNIYAVNHNKDGSKDEGLFQLNSKYSKKIAQEIGIDDFNPYNPYQNIKVGVYMLATNRDYWLGKGIRGEELQKRTLLSYNRGINGSRGYINRYGSTSKYNKAVLKIYEYIKK